MAYRANVNVLLRQLKEDLLASAPLEYRRVLPPYQGKGTPGFVLLKKTGTGTSEDNSFDNEVWHSARDSSPREIIKFRAYFRPADVRAGHESDPELMIIERKVTPTRFYPPDICTAQTAFYESPQSSPEIRQGYVLTQTAEKANGRKIRVVTNEFVSQEDPRLNCIAAEKLGKAIHDLQLMHQRVLEESREEAIAKPA